MEGEKADFFKTIYDFCLLYRSFRVTGCSPLRYSPMAKVQKMFWRKWSGLSQLLRNNINIGYMSALKLMLLEYIYHSLQSTIINSTYYLPIVYQQMIEIVGVKF